MDSFRPGDTLEKCFLALDCISSYVKVPIHTEKRIAPVATQEQMERLHKACQLRTLVMAGLAKRYVEFSWNIRHSHFFQAIRSHLKNGFLVFQKYDERKSIIVDKVQANVVLFEDEDEETGDVYVEFTFRENHVVLIFNAHNHHLNLPRLPRNNE